MENSTPIDRISNLSDDLLTHILSFLPTKLAFSTILLSKRFTPLFKLLTSLRFDDESVYEDQDSFLRFRHFVDKVTLSTQLIKTFHLKCRSIHWRDDSFIVNSWIETVKQHPLENLHLRSTFHNHQFTFPQSIFIFPTLVVLKLKMVGNISVDLPSLKTLHLISVYFKNKQNFNNLLYGCPVLENLVARIHYIEDDVEDATASVPDFNSLSKLITADIDTHVPAFSVISNVKILKLTMKKYRFPEINYMGFSVFQNLIKLHLNIFNFQHWNYVVEVLQYCPKLRILHIFKWEIDNNLSINWKYPKHVPECISFELKSCTIEYECWEDDFQFTKYILQNARFLEVMTIIIHHSLSPKPNRQLFEELSSYPMISTQCKLSIE